MASSNLGLGVGGDAIYKYRYEYMYTLTEFTCIVPISKSSICFVQVIAWIVNRGVGWLCSMSQDKLIYVFYLIVTIAGEWLDWFEKYQSQHALKDQSTSSILSTAFENTQW